MQTANESGLCPVCGNPFNSTAHSPSCETYVGEPKKKTERETFEAKMLEEASFSTIQGMVKQDKAEDLAREADQQIAALSAIIGQYEESITYILEDWIPRGCVVRVHEGGGPESLISSLSVSLLKMMEFYGIKLSREGANK